MKFTYEQVKEISPSLIKLSKLDLKAIEAVKLARLINKFKVELKPFEETEVSLGAKYGELSETGGYSIKPENYAVFSKEYNELLKTDVEIDIDKVEIKSDIRIDAASVMALADVVDFVE